MICRINEHPNSPHVKHTNKYLAIRVGWSMQYVLVFLLVLWPTPTMSWWWDTFVLGEYQSQLTLPSNNPIKRDHLTNAMTIQPALSSVSNLWTSFWWQTFMRMDAWPDICIYYRRTWPHFYWNDPIKRDHTRLTRLLVPHDSGQYIHGVTFTFCMLPV